MQDLVGKRVEVEDFDHHGRSTPLGPGVIVEMKGAEVVVLLDTGDRHTTSLLPAGRRLTSGCGYAQLLDVQRRP